MGFVSGNHILLFIIFLVIVLVIFGPGKLPDVGAGMGKAIREFRKASTDVKDAVMSSHQDPPPAAPYVPPAPMTPPPTPVTPITPPSAPNESGRSTAHADRGA
jgi:sec-independent protein translocase protein TatA